MRPHLSLGVRDVSASVGFYKKVFGIAPPKKVETDDILQEIFLKVHRHIEDLKDPDRLMPWIYQITRMSSSIITVRRKSGATSPTV